MQNFPIHYKHYHCEGEKIIRAKVLVKVVLTVLSDLVVTKVKATL